MTHPPHQTTLSPFRKRELPTNQTYEFHNSTTGTPKLVSLENAGIVEK